VQILKGGLPFRGRRVVSGLVQFHGYNWAMDGCVPDVVNWALNGYAAFLMLVRGQQEERGQYCARQRSCFGWMSKGILSPEEYYYRGVYMDAVRAVEILASLPCVDESRIGVTGAARVEDLHWRWLLCPAYESCSRALSVSGTF